MIYNKQVGYSLRDCIRIGWCLFRKNWLFITVFCLLIPCVTVSSTLFSNALFGIGIVTNYPPDVVASIARFLVTQLTDIMVNFIQFAAIVYVAVKSLVILNDGETEFGSFHKLLRERSTKLVKLWLAITAITRAPPFVAGLVALLFFTDSSSLLSLMSNYTAIVVSFVLGILAMIWVVISFVIQITMTYLICHTVDGSCDNVVSMSLLMVKRTFGKLIMLSLLFVLFSILPFLLLRQADNRFVEYGFLGILGMAAGLFHATILTVLYYDNSRFEPFDDQTEEDYDTQLLCEIQNSESTVDVFQYRVEPSLYFTDVGEFHCGLTRVSRANLLAKVRWGYVNTDGQPVITFFFDEAGDFDDDVAVVRDGLFYYFINTAGKLAIKGRFEQADRFREGFAVVKLDKRLVVIDRDGDRRSLTYDDACGFSEGLMAVRKGGEWLYIDKELSPVFSTGYDEVWSFSDGLAKVRKNGKLGFIDMTGNLAIPLIYNDTLPFNEGIAAVMTVMNGVGLWGYIDRNGQEVIAATFERAGSFRQGYAVVLVNGRCGHINTEGEYVTPPEYAFAGSFSGGYATVGEKAYGYVDTNGQECTSLTYKEARPFSEDLAWVKTEDGWGILEPSDDAITS